jgi:hypothetical protein
LIANLHSPVLIAVLPEPTSDQRSGRRIATWSSHGAIEKTARPSASIQLSFEERNGGMSRISRLKRVQDLFRYFVILSDEEILNSPLATPTLHCLAFEVVQSIVQDPLREVIRSGFGRYSLERGQKASQKEKTAEHPRASFDLGHGLRR